MDRGKWELTKDAEPTIFPNVPKYLNTKLSTPRNPQKRRSVVENMAVSRKFSGNIISMEFENIADDSFTSRQGTSVSASPTPCSKCKNIRLLNSQIYMQNRRLRRLTARTQQLKSRLQKLSAENERMRLKMTDFQKLPPKIELIVSQAKVNAEAKSKTGHRYAVDWILDSLLIRCKSTRAYNMLRTNGYLPLPSISTLNRSIKAMRPEFGFDKVLFEGLRTKLSGFPQNERRGVLMFDEIQISKNLEFRSETGKIVGMVDFGDLTSPANQYQEGDHALVFLYQPHMSGWIQTIGCFCAAGTTSKEILAKLILQAIILLENCGAWVDALISDGASTNRAALASFGFCGEMNKLCNRMKNPCDERRYIYFICDTPHLLKTIRKQFVESK